MKYIWYLCEHPEKDGYVLASELTKGFINPGCWFVQNDFMKEDKFIFPAIFKGKEIKPELIHQKEGSIYRAEIKSVGSFAFFFSKLDNIKYIGKNKTLLKNPEISFVETIKIKQLEEAYKMHDFYFVGHNGV